MFYLLVLVNLLASNVYNVAATTLDTSLLTQLGYNNQSRIIYINRQYITDIDPNAFKGYTKLTNLYLQENALLQIDFAVFKDSVNLIDMYLSKNPLSQLTNSKKVVFPFVQSLDFSESQLTNLDSNVINAFPNLTYFKADNNYELSPLKPNQLSFWKNLQLLRISTKNQTSLAKEHFNGLSLIERLDFTYSNIKMVEVHTLLALPNVTYVDLSNNDIYAFEYLQIPTKLRTLNLAGNKMNYFMLSRTMGYLKYLSINNNLFRSFKSMDFTFLANLTHLDLSNNPHAYPNEIAGHMKPLVNLVDVTLNNLSISSIDSNFFKQNVNLNSIYLNNNKISVLAYNSFNSTKYLSTIDISNNQISVLDNRTFVGLDFLSYLYFQNNKITKIGPKTFFNLNYLPALFLSNNLISEIDSSAFTGCKFGYLNLDNNRLTKLSPGTFSNVKLYSLSLNNNQITEIDNTVFDGIVTESLYLSNNNITSISPGAFNSANINEYLDLSYNQLTKLDNGTFAGQDQLVFINLSYNQISTIEAGAFNDLINLQYIYLNNNNLTDLDISTFAGCNILQRIYLTNNPNLSQSNLQSLCPVAAVNCQVIV